MSVIQIENDFSWLITDNEEVRLKLWKCLRFREKDYAFRAAYKMKVWDGYKDFFSKDSGRFLTGLLPEVQLALKHWNVGYEVKDFRTPSAFAVEQVDENFLPGLKLRDYQVDYINQALTHKRGLVCSVTGSGKTYVMVGIIKALKPGTPVLVLCNQTDLVEQNAADIKKYCTDTVGRVHGESKELDATIHVCTWQSIKHLKHMLPKYKCVIVDEIHLMMSPKVREIYRRLHSASIRIGLSATAFKFDGKDAVQKYSTKGFFGPPFYVKSIEGGKPTTKKLQERDIISEADFTFFTISEPHLPYETYGDAVTKGIAENTYFHDVVSQLALMCKGRTMILVERIKQGDKIKERIPEAAWISGKDNRKTRQWVIERLRSDKNCIAIATTGIFTVGINVFIHNLIDAAGGKAEHSIIQRLGRGLRPAGDKDKLHYYGFYLSMNPYLEKHSVQRIKTLEKEGHKITLKDKFDFNQVRIEEV
jgi:superfamily II DNA or RNA helicase